MSHAPSPHAPNRLAHALSPYLQQHAEDPVDWYPWGEEAFRLAEESNRLIFLSIGYAACHWCHVMAKESFRDPLIAAFMNSHFINIKVDREEFPAVDAIYIQALIQMNGHAGWPASLFLLPDRRPFTGATYLPPVPAHGLPSLRQVLDRILDAWRNNRDAVVAAAEGMQGLLATEQENKAGPRPGWEGYRSAVDGVLRLQDAEFGGFGENQKFPQGALLEFLLLAAHDDRPTARSAMGCTLRAMAERGLTDHLGGGFHRYCVDREWTVPHFEKMLYDNAQLLRVYTRASHLWRRIGDAETADFNIAVAERTTKYLLNALLAPDGTFFSSEDADDPEGEGFFYTFTAAEVRERLGGITELPYGITAAGNFEHGRNVLSIQDGPPPEWERQALLELREQRIRPARDEKRVVAWNGLTLGALAEGGRLLGKNDWIDAAARCGEVLLRARDDRGLLPRVLNGDAPGVLEDQVFVADGWLDLYQAQPWDLRWLDAANDLIQATLEHFGDDAGGCFQSSADSDVIIRRKDYTDGAEPSGNGRLAEVLRRLHAYGAPISHELLSSVLESAGRFMSHHPYSTPELWSVVRGVSANSEPWSLVISGEPSHMETRCMLDVWNATWRPQSALALRVPETEGYRRFGAFADRPAQLDGAPVAYACRFGVCESPVRTADVLKALLEGG